LVISVVGPGRPIAAAGEPETVSVLASSVELWTGTGLGWAYTLPRSQPVCHGGMAGRRAAGNLKLLTHKFDCSVAGRRRWALSVVSARCCSGSVLLVTEPDRLAPRRLPLWHTWSPARAPTVHNLASHCGRVSGRRSGWRLPGPDAGGRGTGTELELGLKFRRMAPLGPAPRARAGSPPGLSRRH